MMFVWTLATVLLCSVLSCSASDFLCYTCSYSKQTEGNTRTCIENPSRLAPGHKKPCNSTSYCVLQEQYDIGKKMVTSYFRTCLGTTKGTVCSHDWTHVTCWASCRGNLCNGRNVGILHEKYIKDHEDVLHLGNESQRHRLSKWLAMAITINFALFTNR